MKGTLYGVGIGPGDPELLTLKAVRLIRENEVIALPGEDPKETVAYKISVQAVPELADKTLLALAMPMTKDKKILKENYDRAADRVAEILDQGKNVVFLTLGDPTVYSTYMYVHQRLEAKGYPVAIVSGITSFCAGGSPDEHESRGEKRAPSCDPGILSDRGGLKASGHQGADEGRKTDEICAGTGERFRKKCRDDRKLRHAG